jgi:uncharacterized protein YjbJ (UPF0337 family)
VQHGTRRHAQEPVARDRTQDIRPRLEQEFAELTGHDLDEAGDDPDQIVSKIQQKTGQPREQVEQRVQQVMKRS